MQRLIAIVMAVLMITAVTSRTLGQSAPTTEPSKCARHPGACSRPSTLTLTADQKAEVKAILQQAREMRRTPRIRPGTAQRAETQHRKYEHHFFHGTPLFLLSLLN